TTPTASNGTSMKLRVRKLSRRLLKNWRKGLSMNLTALSTLKPHAKARRSRRPGLRFQGALLLFLLLTTISTASAAITFDNATASKAKHNTSEISWKHTLGGANTAVVVAVSFNDLLF